MSKMIWGEGGGVLHRKLTESIQKIYKLLLVKFLKECTFIYTILHFATQILNSQFDWSKAKVPSECHIGIQKSCIRQCKAFFLVYFCKSIGVVRLLAYCHVQEKKKIIILVLGKIATDNVLNVLLVNWGCKRAPTLRLLPQSQIP